MTDATSNLVVTSELEAVNTMLRGIGEAPISDLAEPQLLPAVNAKATLRRVSRAVQTEGWNFNRQRDVNLVRDGNNKIPLGSDVLRVDSWGSDAYRPVTKRGGFLFDLKDNTFTFDTDIEAEVIYFLSFEDIPEAARNYITVRAAREFQHTEVGEDSAAFFGFNAADEARARVTLEEYEGDTADHNILTGNYDVYRSLDRAAGVGQPIIDWFLQ